MSHWQLGRTLVWIAFVCIRTVSGRFEYVQQWYGEDASCQGDPVANVSYVPSFGACFTETFPIGGHAFLAETLYDFAPNYMEFKCAGDSSGCVSVLQWSQAGCQG